MSAFRAFALLSALLPAVLYSQAHSPLNSAESAADMAYTAHQWTEAEALYSTLTKQTTDNARLWFRLAVSARADKHYALALSCFDRAKRLGAGTGLPAFVTDYELATTYAANGDIVHAFEALKESADGGFPQLDRLENDAEWNLLRNDLRFTALLKQVQHNAAPCDDPQFRQFDFWLGDWDVTAAGGGPQVGSSHISKEMNGCVIWENWTSSKSGYFGKSYNTFNTNLQQWEQYWVDNSAGAMFFHGSLKNGVMDYWTDDIPQQSGTKLRRHLQFFNLSPAKVRQFSQGSADGEKPGMSSMTSSIPGERRRTEPRDHAWRIRASDVLQTHRSWQRPGLLQEDRANGQLRAFSPVRLTKGHDPCLAKS